MVVSGKKRGFLFVLVGPGGAGKNALIGEMLRRFDGLDKLVTATTRDRRPNELEGHDHYFVTPEEFRARLAAGDFLEHQEVTRDKFYGILRAPVAAALADGKDLIADIDVYGAKILQDTYPEDVVLIFITVPGETDVERLHTLETRMRNADRRDAEEIIQQRLDRARDLELPFAADCDVVIINGDNQMDEAAQHLAQVIAQYRQKRMIHEPDHAS